LRQRRRRAEQERDDSRGRADCRLSVRRERTIARSRSRIGSPRGSTGRRSKLPRNEGGRTLAIEGYRMPGKASCPDLIAAQRSLA
jgi:hypothetical protein